MSPDSRSQRLLVFALIASQFGPPFMFSGVAVGLPALGAELEAGAVSLGLVETLYLAGSLAFLLPIGRLADASDKRSLYKWGLLAFGLCSLLIATLSWVPAILAVRFLQGVTSAIFAVTGTAILADIVPAPQRGRAFGASIGAIYTGLTLGPLAAGWLTEAFGWRAIFIGGAALILAGFAVISALLPAAWRRPTRPFDLSSATLLAATILSLVAGVVTLRQGALGPALLALGLLLAAAFVRWQRRLEARGADPLIAFGWLAAQRDLAVALLTQAMLYTNAFSSIFLFSLYLQVSLGHSADTSGQALAIGSAVMAVVAPFAGRLADRFRPQSLTAVGAGAVFGSALAALTLDATTALPRVIAVLALQSLGFALFSSPNVTLIMNSVDPSATSLASALAAKARSIGMVTGMLLTSLLISLTLGDDPVERHPFALIGTMTTAFTVLAVVTGAAFLICLSARSRRPRRA